MSKTSDAVRSLFKEGDDIRDAGLTTPDDVVRFDDIRYADDDPCQMLDVYRPREQDGEVLPVIVSVHGGAWVYGDKERYQWYCMSLAQRGFAVVNYTYRLAPEHQFPSSMVDTNSVFAWVLDHADEYGMDAGRVFAVGDSAGAHMLSMYCVACTDAHYATELGISTPENFVPSAVALNCGSYRIVIPEQMTGDMMLDLTANLMGDLLPNGGTDEECALISPLDHLNERFPPDVRDDRRGRLPGRRRAAPRAGAHEPQRGGELPLLQERRVQAGPRVPLQHEARRGARVQRRRVRLLLCSRLTCGSCSSP